MMGRPPEEHRSLHLGDAQARRKREVGSPASRLECWRPRWACRRAQGTLVPLDSSAKFECWDLEESFGVGRCRGSRFSGFRWVILCPNGGLRAHLSGRQARLSPQRRFGAGKTALGIAAQGV